jgi:hypothetical protein
MEKYGKTRRATNDNIMLHRKNSICKADNSGKNTLTHLIFNALLFHGYSGYANAPRCYVIRTLPVLFPFPIFVTFLWSLQQNLIIARALLSQKKR